MIVGGRGTRGQRLRRAVKQAATALFHRLFAAPPDQQLWGKIVPPKPPKRTVAVMIVARDAEAVTRN